MNFFYLKGVGKMNTEYEVRVLELNHDEMIKKLESLGAECKFEALQQRYVYDVKPKQENKWIRLRTDGKKTTLTIKDLQAKTIDGTKELEIVVDDFDKTNSILEELGYKNRGFQQNKRTQYILNGVEIDLDRWPLIPEYMEIEGPSIEAVEETLIKLGIKKEEVVTLDVASIYDHYGFDGEHLADLNFEMEEK
jgi:adenylate cyclase class 2